MKVWKYNPKFNDYDFTSDTEEKLILLELELNRNLEDPENVKVKAKAPVKLEFGHWFQLFLNDYNTKYLENPIVYKASQSEVFGWIFFTPATPLTDKKYIDPDLSILNNGLKDSSVIICKRVDKLTS